VRRRIKVIAGTALGVVLLVYWIAMALPNVYTSYASVWWSRRRSRRSS
jgi:orotate phosphoribosyltransferase